MFENVQEDLDDHLLSMDNPNFETANQLLTAALTLGHLLHQLNSLDIDQEQFELETSISEILPELAPVFAPLLELLYKHELVINRERLEEFIYNVKMTAIYEDLLSKREQE